MLNKVVIMGRLTRDPEVRKVNNDVSVCSFSVACDRDIVSKGSNERETDFFDVTAWRSTADFVGKYFAKGRMIVVVGRLHKRSVVDIIAENVYFGDSKKDVDSTGNTAAASYGNNAPADNFADISNEDDGDLPF